MIPTGDGVASLSEAKGIPAKNLQISSDKMRPVPPNSKRKAAVPGNKGIKKQQNY